jgi:peptidoglycan/LPS O-acetylase OafA/YrhL
MFFVLSGFVITWSIDRKKKYLLNQYLFDRMVRLWSVVIPALVIGITMDIFGKSIHPQTYAHTFSNQNLEFKAILSGLFLHESWFFSIRPGSNGPFWSLSYEFFYYLIFGSVALLPTLKSKLFVGITFCLIAGPKVLLLFPCWVVGCASYWACKKIPLGFLLSLLLSGLSFAFLLNIMFFRWTNWVPDQFPGLGNHPFFYSAKYYDDYKIALSVGILLWGLSKWFSLEKKSTGIFSSFIKNCSKCTFSLYAIHFPLMGFLSALWASGYLSGYSHTQGILIVLATSVGFALLFEIPLKKYRRATLKIFPFLVCKCGIHS